MFKVFYPITGKYPVRYSRPSDAPLPNGTMDEKARPCVSKENIDSLADAFAAAIPNGEFSPAEIRGEWAGKVVGNLSTLTTVFHRYAHAA